MDANVLNEQEAINHLIIVIRLIGPVMAPIVGIIAGLIVWAWKRMERSQDKIEEALTAHILSDDAIHDKVFSLLRNNAQFISQAKAYHSVNFPNQDFQE